MTPNHSVHSPGPQIRGMLTVILSAILCAFLIVFVLVRYYGPTGQYAIEQVLMQPDLLPQLSFQEQDPVNGKMGQYVYDHMEYTYYDPDSANWKKSSVSLDQYKKFFSMVSGDQSVMESEARPMDSFDSKRSSVLLLWVKNTASANLRTFQEIAFVPDAGMYRVELRQQDISQPWAYFKHARIYEEAYNLFASP